jgi:hypothetical protein
MSTQHTPGPWIGAGPSFGDPFPRYTTSIVTEREHDDEGIVDICELPFHHRDDENEANARLIAAAPDMLEFLQALNRIGGLGLDVHRQLDALIDKATGEQQ